MSILFLFSHRSLGSRRGRDAQLTDEEKLDAGESGTATALWPLPHPVLGLTAKPTLPEERRTDPPAPQAPLQLLPFPFLVSDPMKGLVVPAYTPSIGSWCRLASTSTAVPDHLPHTTNELHLAKSGDLPGPPPTCSHPRAPSYT